MCGRYLILSPPEALRRLLGYVERPNFPARYNVAPTQPIPVVVLSEGQRHFMLMRWGLLPSWVKDPRIFSLLINARGETVNDKPAFRNAMKRRRCLIPADGFYEWKPDAAGKRPHAIRARDGGPFAFAGLWETWIGPNGEELDTAAIVTTEANATLRPIHHRMPVILEPDAYQTWLDCAGVDAGSAAKLIAPAPDDRLEACEVSTAVNRTANDGPELIAPYCAPPQTDAAPAPSASRAARKTQGGSSQGSLF